MYATITPVRSPTVVGRARELDVLRDALQRARRGHGTWVTVAGEGGIGKTRLIGEAMSSAADAGATVLVGRCSSVDRRTPYRPLAEAFLAAAREIRRPDPACGLDPYLPAVARFVPHWGSGAPGVASESAAVVGESVLRVLEWLGGGSPTLLVLEDLHWADADTIAVLDYVVDHLAGRRAAVVGTVRMEDADDAVLALLGRTEVLSLALLSAGEIAEVAGACLGAPLDPERASQLATSSGGLPLLVEDLLDDRRPGGGPARFAALVDARLSRLSHEARRALAAAALLGERASWQLLDSLLASLGYRSGQVLHELAAADLVVRDGESFRFRHAMTRDVVLAGPTAATNELAGAVAATLEKRGVDGDLARAAELRLTAGDAGSATMLLRRAAARAAGQGAIASALDLIARAAVVAPDRSARRDVAVQRLELLVTHGRADDALVESGSVLDATATDPELHDHVRLLVARAAVDAGRPTDALALLDACRGRTVDAPARLVVRARAVLGGDGADRRVVAEHLARQAVASAEATDTPDIACEALDLVARCARSRSLDDAEAALLRALGHAERGDLALWGLRVLNELGTIDMLRAADGSRLLRAHRQALALGALDIAVGTAVNIAALHAMRGELDETAAAAERAEADALTLGLGPLAAAANVMWALSDGFRGRRDAMERRLARAEALAPDDADLRAFAWGAGRGLCALVREERDEAVSALRRAVRTSAAVGSLDTGRGPLLLVLAAAGDATDEHLSAAIDTATPGAGWSDLWVGYGRAAMVGMGGDGVAAAALFASAEPAARRHPLFRAIGLRLLAEAAARDGWGEPVEWLRDAEAVFVAGGQDRIASACRSLLGRIGVPTTRRRGADRALPSILLRHGVTAREAEVLELIGERLGNKDIAARLFLSPRTVEKHVASLLTKLDAPSRARLGEVARGL